MKQCKKCGKEWPDAAQFCGVCGATLEETKEVHFTRLSGRHSVLERPLSEVNGRPFFS